MSDNQLPIDDRQRKSTLIFFRIVLVMSIIGSSSNFFGYLFLGIQLPTFQSLYESGSMAPAIELASEAFGFDKNLLTASYESMLNVPRSFYLLSSFLYAMSLAGCIMMMCLRKNGFHYYTIAQLLIIIITVLFLGKEYVGIGNIMMTLLFVVYYYTSLRRLGLFSPKQEEDGINPQDNDENGQE